MKTLEHPYALFRAGEWLRGNLHTHSTQSDGQRPIQDVVDDYASRGYGFLMMSDHDVLTSAQYAGINPRGLILIPGNEVTAHGPHLLHVNASERIAADSNRQAVINAAISSGGFVVMNHPNWFANFNHCTIDQLRDLTGYVGIEIYNGVISRLEGSPYATDKWDMLLGSGRRVWGFANDDSHASVGDVELGWNVAQVREKSVGGIVDALTSGRFYASTGVVIDDIEVDGMTIRISTQNADRIIAFQQTGRRFAQVDAKVMEVKVPDSARYVRLECWGRGEQFAWTQPFFVVEQ